MPDTRRRGIIRWILLALNAFPFAGLIAAYPMLLTAYPDILIDNRVRLAIQAWAAVILLHLLVVCMLEVRENIISARRARRRHQEFEQTLRQRRRTRYGEIFGKSLD